MRVTCMYVCMYIILYTDIILIYLLYIYITYYCIICQHLSISGLHFWCRLWHHVAMVRRWQWPFDRQRHQRLTGPECPGCVGRDWGHRLGERQPHGSWGSGKAEWMSPDVTSFGFWILMDLWIFMCIWGILRRSTLLSTCVFLTQDTCNVWHICYVTICEQQTWGKDLSQLWQLRGKRIWRLWW